jgi:hypothetical protein
MQKVMKSGAAAVLATVAQVAQAAGDSGTSSVGEMQVTGSQLAMMVGALVGLGLVVWLLAKRLFR